jgi:uncharacterized protein YxjI
MTDTAETDLIGNLDLTGGRYVVVQSLIRPRYRVDDADGRTVLKGRQKRFKLREEFPFTDPDGNVVFRLQAQNVFDVAGDYTLVDEASGEAFAVVEKEFTLFKHVYRLRSPDGALWATLESESAAVMALKQFVGLLSVLPHAYSIAGPDGERLGTVEERFSLRDVYDVTLGETGDVPREAVLAAAVAIDALEGN